MKIDLTEVLQSIGNEADIDESLPVDFAADGLKLTGPVKVALHLTNTGGSILLAGKVTTEVELECSRCLKPFTTKLEAEIAEEFSHSVQTSQARKELELKEDDFVYPIDQDNTIDLTELVRQELLLSLPFKPLCLNQCPGINKEGEK
ncbi:hypothetical protein COT42_02415 [Candidatus Saganbacteria bacterium CG08_land_8_20_14_0_20_45_16]|uniref:DUF177 domain-containing protein n=1 Tax=Candidatus Saganbacteria bacterium CG08_land_8_20_14_0_20_45_16 TaxID=2014293 RepID=A0A2H0Y086_UNCSA|nr:MAG: hypothetical protein COT42_02415 [Candidatus Saganbacteria bacterium CG08_land_8_20_14_0_20_45_16]